MIAINAVIPNTFRFFICVFSGSNDIIYFGLLGIEDSKKISKGKPQKDHTNLAFQKTKKKRPHKVSLSKNKKKKTKKK